MTEPIAVVSPAGPRGNFEQASSKCATCSMHQLCLPMALEDSEMDKLDQIIGQRRRVEKGEHLFNMGDGFSKLQAIRLGHFKTFQVNAHGEEQVIGFQMGGEVLGMDAISLERHDSSAVALEDSEVCEIPFDGLEKMLMHTPSLLRHFHRMMSQQITREQSTMLLLGNMPAAQRFAAFLVNLASRYEARGYSSTAFNLRMSREEIGNYLGLTIESISRLINKFKSDGLLAVSNRDVRVLDMPRLKAIMSGLN